MTVVSLISVRQNGKGTSISLKAIFCDSAKNLRQMGFREERTGLLRWEQESHSHRCRVSVERSRNMLSEYQAHLATLPSEVHSSDDLDAPDLDLSYEYCMDVFKLHARSFHFASRYLNEEERKSIAALYGFCRLVDDFADEMELTVKEIEHELDLLKDIAERLAKGEVFSHPLFRAFGHTMAKYRIPVRYLHELIEGVRMDLRLKEIETVEELDKYCYHVASTVGLMMCHIWGSTDPETLDRAADLGVALQLTNILRDVAEDYDNGRIYLPKKLRDEFRVPISDFENRTVSPNFELLLKHEIARAHSIYAKAEIGLQDLPPAASFTVRVAAEVYGEIMHEIEKMDYQVFEKRAVVPKWRKLWIAFKLRRKYNQEKKAYDSLQKD